DFVYHDDHATSFNLADDADRVRLNNRYDATTGIGTLRWRPRSGPAVSLHEDFFRKAQGLPGLGSNPALNSRLAFQRSLTRLEIAEGEPGAARAGPARLVPATRVALEVERERNRFRDDGGALGLGELRVGRHNGDDHFDNDRATFELAWAGLP